MGNISELYDNLEKVTKDLKEQRILLPIRTFKG